MPSKSDNLIWLDLEMTGLIPRKDKIIEIATVVTDSHLNIIAEGPEIVIKRSKTMLNDMDEWNTTQHKKSGLLDRMAKKGTTIEKAEQETLEFLKQYVDPNASPMCGNSICQDRRFLYEEMPTLENFFHYRQIDVSSIKILAQRWSPGLLNRAIKKTSSHRAKDDVIDSINELKFYQQQFFNL